MQDFKKLNVWNEAHIMTLNIYKLTRKNFFFDEEKFGLVQQIRRAATSICLNIAEGAGSNSQAKFAYYLYNAQGSCKEVECCLLLAKDLGYITEEVYNSVFDKSKKIGGMLVNLIKRVKTAQKPLTSNVKLSNNEKGD